MGRSVSIVVRRSPKVFLGQYLYSFDKSKIESESTWPSKWCLPQVKKNRRRKSRR